MKKFINAILVEIKDNWTTWVIAIAVAFLVNTVVTIGYEKIMINSGSFDDVLNKIDEIVQKIGEEDVRLWDLYVDEKNNEVNYYFMVDGSHKIICNDERVRYLSTFTIRILKEEHEVEVSSYSEDEQNDLPYDDYSEHNLYSYRKFIKDGYIWKIQ